MTQADDLEQLAALLRTVEGPDPELVARLEPEPEWRVGSESGRSLQAGRSQPGKAVLVEAQAVEVNTASGDVLIDSTGVTIRNGKLVLQDEFGKSTLVAGGFAGSWSDFIATGIYNGSFTNGNGGSVPAGRTAALPYWTVQHITGSPTVTHTTLGFLEIDVDSAKTVELVSDAFAVFGGLEYYVQWLESNTSFTPGTVAITTYIDEYDASVSFLRTITFATRNRATANPDSGFEQQIGPRVPGASTRFWRVRHRVAHVSGSNEYTYGPVSLSKSPASVDMRVFTLGSDVTLSNGSDTSLLGPYTVYANRRYSIRAICDFEVSAQTPGVVVGKLYLDAVAAYPPGALFEYAGTGNGRATVFQEFQLSADANDRTVELKGTKMGTTGTAKARTHTRLVIEEVR